VPSVPRTSLTFAAVLVAAIAGKAGLFAEPRPASVSIHALQDLPDGPGKAVVVRLCAGCHDLMFALTTRETEEGWTRIINDMRSKGTDGTEAEFEQVIAYFAAHMGKPERPAGHVSLELLASRTQVAPGERFALGVRLVASAGWHLTRGAALDRWPNVSWTVPQAVSVGDPAPPAADAPSALVLFPVVVSTSAVPGSTLDLTVRVAYEVCREACSVETATASITLPVGDGGVPRHEIEFENARAMPRR
jgi:hypothetical protein